MSRFRGNFAKANPIAETSGSAVPKALFQQARKTGQLNLSGRDFKEVPDQVWRLHAPSDGDTDMNFSDSEKWWDQVELTKLILASNQLVSLSESISVFPTLTVLDLHDNKLIFLPEAISSLKVLEKLDVSHNELGSLPESLPDMERLVTLFMQHNRIATLPKQFGLLGNIRNLDASNNQLQNLPDDWSQMINLQRLNLSANQLVKVPADICQLPLLSFLDLSSNKLSVLPMKWANLSSLKELYLRSNSLSALPNLCDCGNLKELYCARNSFSSFDVGNLPTSLMIVEFRDNKIKEIGEDIIKLKELQRFDVSNNDISTLPPKMGLMEHVKALNVEGNPMRGIRRDIVNKGTLAIIQYLCTRIVTSKEANGDQNDQSLLPMSSEVAGHTKMHALATSKTLDLSNKPFTPDLMDDCADIPLEVVSLSKVGISEIPTKLSLFQQSLKNLNCSVNKISFVDAMIGSFASLTHLNLASNLLVSLPAELSGLRSLIELNIMQNKFKQLPDCVFTLSSLEHLLAGGNQIEKVDANGLLNLSKLATLSLQNNNISQVPPELGLIPSLKNLQLEGNTFRIPRQNILQQGSLAVIEYLKGRVPRK